MTVSLTAALLGGLAFFFSPCVWPLYPAYIGYLTGTASDGGAGRPRVLGQALLFILGFSTVFLALGATASLLGQVLAQYQNALREVSGLLIIGFGAYLAGILPEWLLGGTRTAQMTDRPATPFAAYSMGLAFGFGWTPCVGPILASILLLTSTTASLRSGLAMLAVYSLGFSVPFFVLALFLERFRPLFRAMGRHLSLINRISGYLLIVLGVLVFTNALTKLSWALYYKL